MYEIDFLPEETRDKPQINPEDSPHYELYQAIQQQDFDDFYEVDEDEDEQPANEIQKLGIQTPELKGSQPQLTSSQTRMERGVDSSDVSPSMVRAKFREAVKASPTVPVPRAIGGGSPKNSPAAASPRRNIVQTTAKSQISAPGGIRVETETKSAPVAVKGAGAKAAGVASDNKTEKKSSSDKKELPAAPKQEKKSDVPIIKTEDKKNALPEKKPLFDVAPTPKTEGIENESIFERMKREVEQQKKPASNVGATGLTRSNSTRKTGDATSLARQKSTRQAGDAPRKTSEATKPALNAKEREAQRLKEESMPEWMKQLRKEKETKTGGAAK